MNDILSAILLGIIEGITEFLPISSTGHLLIAERWLGHRSDLFNISIQAGAILAVVLIYRQRLWQLATQFFTEHESREYAWKLATAFLVTAVPGLVLKKLGFQPTGEIAPRHSAGRNAEAPCRLFTLDLAARQVEQELQPMAA